MKQGRQPTGIYVYCITEGRPLRQAQSRPFAAARGLHPLRRVYSLAHEDLVAVVSRVPGEQFGEEALPARLQDASWLEREARAHEQVIEKVMEGRTVLPMKFCTIFRSEGRVRALLREREGQFRGALAQLREKQEWGVRMYFQPPLPAAPSAQAGLSGKEYLLRKRAEHASVSEVWDRANRQAQHSFEQLAGCVEQIQVKPLLRRVDPPEAGEPSPLEASGAPLLVLDAVCLLAGGRFPAFHEQLAWLGDELAGQGFRFELSGPWPPYHFAAEAQASAGIS